MLTRQNLLPLAILAANGWAAFAGYLLVTSLLHSPREVTEWVYEQADGIVIDGNAPLPDYCSGGKYVAVKTLRVSADFIEPRFSGAFVYSAARPIIARDNLGRCSGIKFVKAARRDLIALPPKN